MVLLQNHRTRRRTNGQSNNQCIKEIMTEKKYSLNDLIRDGLMVSATGQPTYSPNTIIKYLKRFGHEPTKRTPNGMAYELTRKQIEEMNRLIVAPYL